MDYKTKLKERLVTSLTSFSIFLSFLLGPFDFTDHSVCLRVRGEPNNQGIRKKGKR